MQLRSDNSITRGRHTHNAIEESEIGAHTECGGGGGGAWGRGWTLTPATCPVFFHHRSCAQSSRISSQARSSMHSLSRRSRIIFSPSIAPLWSWPRQLECRTLKNSVSVIPLAALLFAGEWVKWSEQPWGEIFSHRRRPISQLAHAGCMRRAGDDRVSSCAIDGWRAKVKGKIMRRGRSTHSRIRSGRREIKLTHT